MPDTQNPVCLMISAALSKFTDFARPTRYANRSVDLGAALSIGKAG